MKIHCEDELHVSSFVREDGEVWFPQSVTRDLVNEPREIPKRSVRCRRLWRKRHRVDQR
jgi:hypothetical protein